MANRYLRVPRGRGPIPNGEIVHLKYNAQFSITATGGAQTAHIFKINSIFDPDLTLVGHQPYGRDQLATLFTYYQVYRCSWRIWAINTSATSTGSSNTTGVVVVVPSTESSVTGTPGYPGNLEMPRAVVKLINNNDDAGRAVVWKGSIHMANLFNIPKGQFYGEGEYGALMTSDPAQLAYLHVLMSNADANTTSVKFMVQLTYDCKVWEPQDFGAS